MTAELNRKVTQRRDSIENAFRDQASAEHLRRTQLEDRLKALQAKEDNLLDLASDGSLPQDRIRHRLRDIGREREALREQLNSTTADLNAGKQHIEAFLELLTDIRTLYIQSSNEIRRELNQAIFNNMYVAHDEVVGDDVKLPLRELLAAQRGWNAHNTGKSEKAAHAAAGAENVRRKGPECRRTVISGGPSGSDLVGLGQAILTGIFDGGDSSRPLVVGPEGV